MQLQEGGGEPVVAVESVVEPPSDAERLEGMCGIIGGTDADALSALSASFDSYSDLLAFLLCPVPPSRVPQILVAAFPQSSGLLDE